MKPYILVFVDFVCFGTGMVLGSYLADTIWCIVIIVVTGLGCVVMLSIPPRRKKRLPVRRGHLKLVSSRKSANSR